MRRTMLSRDRPDPVPEGEPSPKESYFDREFEVDMMRILPGEYYATRDATAITTLLGSCVSVCLYDRGIGVGGMNHFMLPQKLMDGQDTHCASPLTGACTSVCSGRYGSCAMRQLLALLEQLGAKANRLEAKVFGGGRVMAGMTDIGARNAEFSLAILAELGIPVLASDLGGTSARRVTFFPATGRALVKRLQNLPEGVP